MTEEQVDYLKSMILVRQSEAIYDLHKAISRCNQEGIEFLDLLKLVETEIETVYTNKIWIEVLTDGSQ